MSESNPQPETPLTLNGKPLTDGPLAVVPPQPKTRWGRGRPGRALLRGEKPLGIVAPDPEPPKPLIEQAKEVWLKIAATDPAIASALKRREETYYALSRVNQDIRLRMKFLRKKAVITVQRRNGIRTIPGFLTPEGGTRKDVLEMAEHLRKLLAQHALEMPPELVEPPSNEQPPDPSPPAADTQP